MASYTPGTYEGAARGYGGKLFVRVTVSEDRIEAVTVTQHKEYRGIAWGLNTTPIERYPELIVEYQTLNIPVVDGADLTCAAILDATAAALKAAGASKEDIAALRAAPAPKAPEYPDEVRTVDVVVCGAGAGGLAAAIEAKLAGADVVIVEKQGITGGATARSGGKLLGAGTRWQKKQGLFDTKDMVYDYLMDVGNRSGKFMDESKNRYLVDHLNQTLDWLTSIEATVKGDPVQVLAQPWEPLSKPVEKDGVLKTHFDVLDVEPIHVSLQPWRVHNSPGGGGQTNGEGGEISTPLTLYYENDLGGEIIYDTAMDEILTDEAAERLGARNFEHPAVQVVYTSLTNGVGINDESGLIVNDRGERVVNEWSYQYTVSDAIARSGSNCAWYITSGKEPYGGVQYGYKAAVAGKSKDPCAASIEGLAKKMGCDPATLQATYDRYCELVERGVDEDFGKPAEFLHPIKGPKFVALRLHPCVTVTFGGLETDISARVMKPDGSVIPHLYAAGEVAGTGMYGTQYPTCGTSIGSALFYGRIAGRAVTDQALL